MANKKVKSKMGVSGKKIKKRVGKKVKRPESYASSSGDEKSVLTSRRISFGDVEIRHKHEFTGTPSESNKSITNAPLRSILKRKLSQNSTTPKKEVIKPKVQKLSEENDDKMEHNKNHENYKKQSSGCEGATKTLKDNPHRSKIKKIQVSRSVKEKLATMDRRQRKQFLTELRLKHKPYAEIAIKAKKLWEVMRSSKTTKSKREEAITELVELVRGKTEKLIFAHDTVRVIQCLMTLHDRKDIRNMLYDELQGLTLKMSKSRYARFFVKKMFKYGTSEQRASLLRHMRTHFVEMLRHTYANEIIELAYNDYANARQRTEIIAEFYGPQATIALLEHGDEAQALERILNDSAKKVPMLNSLRESLLAIAEKQALRHSLVHTLLYQYTQHCTTEQLVEIFDAIRERILEIVHTKHGVTVAMKIVWKCNAKDRKKVIKALKGLVVKSATDEHGALFLMSLFDCVDDTVLLNKMIVQELMQNLPIVLGSKHGLRVIEYLIYPRDGRFVLKELRDLLALGDDNAESRKQMDIRRRELRLHAAPTIADHIARYMGEYLYEKGLAVFILALLEVKQDTTLEHYKEIPADKRAACYSAIAEQCALEFIPSNFEANRLHTIEHPSSNFVITKLTRQDNDVIQRLGIPAEETLSHVLCSLIVAEKMREWSGCNRGCMILSNIVESNVPSAAVLISSMRSKEFIGKLQDASHKGAQELLSKLNAK